MKHDGRVDVLVAGPVLSVRGGAHKVVHARHQIDETIQAQEARSHGHLTSVVRERLEAPESVVAVRRHVVVVV